MQTFDTPIVEVLIAGAHTIVRTQRSIYVDADVREIATADIVGMTRTPDGLGGLAVHHDPTHGRVWLTHIHDATADLIGVSTPVDEVAVRADAVFVRRERQVSEVRLIELSGRVLAATTLRARVLPHASHLFDGVAIQSVEGASFASLLDATCTPQIRIPDLDGIDPVDAAHAGSTLVVLGARQGRFDLWAFEGLEDPDGYVANVHRDVHPGEIAWATDGQGEAVWVTPVGIQRGQAAGARPLVIGSSRPVSLLGGLGWIAGPVLYREDVCPPTHCAHLRVRRPR